MSAAGTGHQKDGIPQGGIRAPVSPAIAANPDFISTHCAGMALVMKQNKPPDPLYIDFCGAVRAMLMLHP
ncbi:hypothetical protein PROH_08225 [Prochlorothrix hollandica PCC 9006 = CALU 1027]|uniref:Uncharacterized protein n=1 Tax=Prochlorothrix hollandica PCC 9006 = CALU 1027 TaxID=317619 RepID=A0A0M2PUN9_PROHO|nr:hypothetical protein PROH_08225 [Prochlorothrix hollandica PCC 9006 = CALU 1027]